MRKSKYIIGVDEVGRGPLAGPVTVGAVLIPRDFEFPKIGPKDSKKLSQKKREEWFLYARGHNNILYTTASISSSIIDKINISKATLLAVERALGKLFQINNGYHSLLRIGDVEVLLDGLLRAPKEYKQKTIIRGDEKVPVISLASIIAKVTRDAYMVKTSEKYPQYGFENHKGYGTKKHYEAIKKYGAIDIHRKSFLKDI